MQSLILVLHMLFSLCLITLVLMQHGKGADAGASFGGGASNTMFGSQGTTPFLVKLTALVAGLFIATSLILGYMAYRAEPVSAPVADTYENALDSVASEQTTPLTEQEKK
ncbi:MAG TPA: preprotein translocase subunit SecG [Coxiellaceae bacterium]|nr:preprotein translocase subunit SecG [Coxiellaceae bacterium]